MPSSDRKVQVYEELAEWEHQNGSPQARDRFLILAADAALAAGQNDEAEQFRSRLLDYNPHHLLKPYASLAEAMKSSEVFSYVADLRGSYPVEEAQQLLSSLQKGGKSSDQGNSEFPPSPPTPPELDRALPEIPPPPPPPETMPGPAGAGTETWRERSGEETPYPLPGNAKTRRAIAPHLTDDQSDDDETDEKPGGIGMLVGDALIALVAVAGLALLVYTLARPYLQLPDAPLWH